MKLRQFDLTILTTASHFLSAYIRVIRDLILERLEMALF
jgi:hypothetical protein